MRFSLRSRSKQIALLCLVAALTLGTAAMATPLSDPDRDAAVSATFKLAAERGERSPVVVSAVKADANTLRSQGLEVPITLTGPIWAVTVSGKFDIGRRPPSGPLADPSSGIGIFHRMVVFVRDGNIVGGNSYR